MADINDFGFWAMVDGLADGPVRIEGTSPLSDDLLLVHYTDENGVEGCDFIDDSLAAKLTVRDPTPTMYRYPAGVVRLFPTRAELFEPLRRARKRHLLHVVAQAYLAEIARRLRGQFSTVCEIHATAGARNDALSLGHGFEVLWEIFGTTGRIEEDLRKLERNGRDNRITVAVVVDAEIDARLFNAFARKVQGGSVTAWFRLTDLMVNGAFEEAVARVDREIEKLLAIPTAADHLELVGFGLEKGLSQWKPTPEIPYGFTGLAGDDSDPLEDPLFWVDLLNAGGREARIASAFIHVRMRHIKLHGIPEPRVLTPVATFVLPLNDGEEGYREVELDGPILVPAGQHARFLVRLDDAGFAWRGEVEIGFRYGGGKRICRLPAITIFL